MDFGVGALLGFCFGFSLGVGCALAVMYSIYTGGYRKAVEDGMRGGTSERYVRTVAWAKAKSAHPR